MNPRARDAYLSARGWRRVYDALAMRVSETHWRRSDARDELDAATATKMQLRDDAIAAVYFMENVDAAAPNTTELLGMGLASWLLAVAREFWKEEVGDGTKLVERAQAWAAEPQTQKEWAAARDAILAQPIADVLRIRFRDWLLKPVITPAPKDRPS